MTECGERRSKHDGIGLTMLKPCSTDGSGSGMPESRALVVDRHLEYKNSEDQWTLDIFGASDQLPIYVLTSGTSTDSARNAIVLELGRPTVTAWGSSSELVEMLSKNLNLTKNPGNTP